MGTDYYENRNNGSSVFAGLLIGSLAGAAAMFLLAPRSGKETRTQIQAKGIELRDRATGMAQDVVKQVSKGSSRITIGGRKKAQALLEQSQVLVLEQLDRVSEAALAGKQAIKDAVG